MNPFVALGLLALVELLVLAALDPFEWRHSVTVRSFLSRRVRKPGTLPCIPPARLNATLPTRVATHSTQTRTDA